MSYDILQSRSHHEGQVAEFILGPPPGNILTARLMGEIVSEMDRIVKTSPRCKLIVIAGDGKHFSYGASVEEHTAESVGEMLPSFHALIGSVLECPVPTLAKVTGMCLGGSFELAMACSVIVCTDGASFGVPEIQLGVFPPVACALLPLVVGAPLATEMILTGGRYGSDVALRSGLVSRVVPDGSLDEALDEFIEKEILPKSASSLRIANRATRGRLAVAYREQIGALERLYLDELMDTSDANEGIRSFLEKRRPVWKDA